MKSKQATSDALKITHQSRSRGGMLYGLTCKGQVLSLVVTPRTNPSEPDEWLVEARAKRAMHEDVVAAEWGTTKIEALRAVGRSWAAAAHEHGLAMFDWEAVVKVLTEVRAV